MYVDYFPAYYLHEVKKEKEEYRVSKLKSYLIKRLFWEMLTLITYCVLSFSVYSGNKWNHREREFSCRFGRNSSSVFFLLRCFGNIRACTVYYMYIGHIVPVWRCVLLPLCKWCLIYVNWTGFVRAANNKSLIWYAHYHARQNLRYTQVREFTPGWSKQTLTAANKEIHQRTESTHMSALHYTLLSAIVLID